MIEQITQKIITTYDNLPPKRKALADMVGMLFAVVIGTGIVFTIAHFGLWMEMAIGLVVYAMLGMLSLIYKSRVAYYEYLDTLNNLGKK